MRFHLIIVAMLIIQMGCKSSSESDIESLIISLNKPGPDVQVLLIGDRFQNTHSENGKYYLYDVTFYAVVSERDVCYMEDQFSSHAARNSQSITEIMARASIKMLNDPSRRAIRQAILEVCQERFGLNRDGVPYVRGIEFRLWEKEEFKLK